MAKVPAFIAANTFAGFVSFCAGGPAAIDGGSGTGEGEAPLPNGDCPKPGLNPVGSVKDKKKSSVSGGMLQRSTAKKDPKRKKDSHRKNQKKETPN